MTDADSTDILVFADTLRVLRPLGDPEADLAVQNAINELHVLASVATSTPEAASANYIEAMELYHRTKKVRRAALILLRMEGRLQ